MAIVKDYEPAMSFGEDVAATYDEEEVRGDEDDTVEFLARLAGNGPVLERRSGQAGSGCRWLPGVCASQGSISRPPWRHGCGPNRAAATSS
jgi:hypothetical protein